MEGFLKLAAKEPKRIKLVKASKGVAEIHEEVMRIDERVLKNHSEIMMRYKI